ncbi:hypothetical protein FA10DRAFT_266134 [Acaromyces ingoldii]|uniref:Uncharacterized protein n=1 Tax=Acaromyces ingoldii TaxID=215250 RepID=A0A316YX27_9BASI|nr:hypothetical protein FA10DRAFT_266134 [Acaromyces ingoldii]PWN92355.1 hypothetical protein FA10DRAFT_266134 [Acaromyces ingoldii]
MRVHARAAASARKAQNPKRNRWLRRRMSAAPTPLGALVGALLMAAPLTLWYCRLGYLALCH